LNNFDLSPKNLLRIFKEYALIHLGCLIYSFAWVGIIEPAGGIGGGASGLALLVQYATGGVLPMGIGYIIINSILLVAALATVGKSFGIKTVWGIASISLWLNVLGLVVPENFLGLADDRLLSMILAGVVMGISVGLCLMQGGSTGGTDIVSQIINKYRRVSYGKVVVISDFTIIAASYFVYRTNPDIVNPMAMIIYGYVLVGVFSYTVELVMAGTKQSSQIFILSKNWETISKSITQDVHRGVTVLDGMGAYTHQPAKMLVVMCRKVEANNVLRIVKQIDPAAFVSVSSVMGVYGKGFDKIEVRSKKHEHKA
jgi:uncharacterized membrane-anchored protein YitT (DUF2179 family)